MAILVQPQQNKISPRLIPLTPLNLYLERCKGIAEKLRADVNRLDYIPLQFGGLSGQQESLLANSVVRIVDFKVQNNE